MTATAPFPSDLEIARAVRPRPIIDVAHDLGLRDDEIELYGSVKAKVTLDGLRRVEATNPRGKYVVVTAISPTPLGEGKSTTTVGLAQGLNRIGRRAAVTVRQPSLGPVFGIKGGAAGGGYSQIIPMEDFNLHLTGDVHAMGAAHNLAAAFIDNHIHHGNELGIDANNVLWPRVVDISDRALRDVVVGLGGKENGYPRQAQFVITVASEVMAILALASDLTDLRVRLGRIVLATKKDGTPITADDLKVAGSMTVLLRDALMPNLLQTLEGGPAFVHCGPFGNIAHGNSSILADRVALATNDIVVTEAGFGADLGAEKFFDIKCRASGLRPDAAVVVATIRALKMHGGVGRIVAGKPLDPALITENVDAVRAGGANLEAQIANVRAFNVPVVVAINTFPTDTPAEIAAVREVALAAGARDAVVARHFVEGAPAPRTWPRPSGPPPRRALPTSSSCTGTTCRSRRRSSPSRPASTGRTAWTTCRPPRRRSPSTRGWASAAFRSAWPRPSTASATTPSCSAGRPDSGCRSARSGCRPAPASSSRSPVTCGRCRACRRDPAASGSTSTPTGTSSGCSETGSGRRLPAAGRHSGSLPAGIVPR